MRVFKFGGSVLKDANDIKNILSILNSQVKRTEQVVVVVSAFFDVTNSLLELVNEVLDDKDYKNKLSEIKSFHKKITKELNFDYNQNIQVETLLIELESILFSVDKKNKKSFDCLYDGILSIGERLSSLIIFNYLHKHDDVVQIFPNEIIKTNSDFGHAKVNIKKSMRLIGDCIKNINAKIIICAGFFGSDENEKITTLGRNGSDYTASLIASAVDAEQLVIWKDTDGLYTADPKIVKNVKFIKQITYQEMAELSSLGNKILHIDAIAPCVTKHIPIVLRNCYNVNCNGTLVFNKKCENYLINGITKLDEVRVITIFFNENVDIVDILIKIQQILKNYSDIVITISENIKQKKFSLLIFNKKSDKLFIDIKNKLRRNKCINITIGEIKSMITIIGANFSSTVGVSGKIFNVLNKNKININALHDDFSSTRISFLCSTSDVDKAINLLHDELLKQ